MYVPAAFRQDNPAVLRAFLRRYSFALLTSVSESGLMASHLPLLLEENGDATTLVGHFARANPQWRGVSGEVMAVFSGPHAYVSPSWYGERGTVPTWNYTAVHAYGTLRLVDDRDELLELLRRTVHAYEDVRETPWAFDESDEKAVAMAGGVVGFRVEVTRLEGKWKLSQNHPEGRRARVMAALAASDDPTEREVAALMREYAPGADGGRR